MKSNGLTLVQRKDNAFFDNKNIYIIFFAQIWIKKPNSLNFFKK